MKKYLPLILSLILVSAGCSRTIDYQERLCRGQWFWNSDLMYEDCLMFLQEPNSPASANLLFTPSRLISLTSAAGDVEYTPGRDFTFSPGSRTITLTADSRIPRKDLAEMYPPPGPWAEGSIPACRDKNCNLFWAEGHVFHDLQVVVTYEHQISGRVDLQVHAFSWPSRLPKYDSRSLPRTREKLCKQENIKLVLFGDSISTGANASGVTGAPPYQPFFGQMVANILAKKYSASITFENFSRGGMSSGWGKENINLVADRKPDLVIFAWGINDAAGRISPDIYKTNMQAQIDAVRAVSPQAEFILVATMTANPEWSAFSGELYDQYRDMLARLCDSSVVLADVTSVWEEVLRHKKFADLTGNGVNHPNDFGHRLYAEVILSLLIPPQ